MKQYLSYMCMTVLLALSGGMPVLAQGNLGSAGNNLSAAAKEAGTSEGEVSVIVGTAINALLTLVGLFFLVLMVYAGYLWMTARGESEQVDKAKKIITSALIGLVITVSAYAITVFVTTRFS